MPEQDVKFRNVVSYGKRFPVSLKGVVYRSYARVAIKHWSDVWYWKE